MLVTNHVYEVIGSYIPTKEMGGGTGLKYAASTIAYLGKKKERDGTDVIGNIIKVKMQKSRLSKENKQVECLLSYEKGLDRYYGLVDMGVDAGIFKKISNRVELPDGKKMYAKQIYENPKEYFTDGVMEDLEKYSQSEYMYGANDDIEDEIIEDEVE